MQQVQGNRVKKYNDLYLLYLEYFKVVENALAAYNPKCVTQIKRANQMIHILLKTNKGAEIVKKKFK